MTGSTAVEAGEGRDDIPTLLALGIIVYMVEILLHEGVGHGGVCLATGGRVTLLTPLWMRCSVVTPAMVFAGPAANVLAALVSWALLRADAIKGDGPRLFLWLTLAFNGLVAAGYLGVGGALAFGDWRGLAGIRPEWLRIVGAIAAAGVLYYGVLRVLAAEYWRIGGAGAGQALSGRALVPALGAAGVATAAQIYGQGTGARDQALLLASTLLVGASLRLIRRWPAASPATSPGLRIRRCPACIVAALVLGAAHVAVIGPGTSFGLP